MKVFKYQLNGIDTQSIEMPIDAKILTVQVQHSQVCLYALVDETKKSKKRHFRLAGPGHEIGEAGTYIGSFQLYGGYFVGHVFEVK